MTRHQKNRLSVSAYEGDGSRIVVGLVHEPASMLVMTCVGGGRGVGPVSLHRFQLQLADPWWEGGRAQWLHQGTLRPPLFALSTVRAVPPLFLCCPVCLLLLCTGLRLLPLSSIACSCSLPPSSPRVRHAFPLPSHLAHAEYMACIEIPASVCREE